MTSTTPSTLFRIGLVQMTSTDNVTTNYTTCVRLAQKAAAQNVQLLSFPECFHFIGGGTTGLKSVDIAETLEGPTIQKYQDLARATNLTLSLGGFQEKSEDASKVYNTHVVIDPTGTLIAAYRKIHLFDYEAGGLMESTFTLPGNRIQTVQCAAVNCDAVTVGLSTCYDVRFPQMYQTLRDLGASLILVPSAFTVATGTQSYVLAAAQAGIHNEKRTSYGHALVVDPWGVVVAEAHSEGEGEGSSAEQLLIVDVDLALVDRIRTKMPIAEHTRNDVYTAKDQLQPGTTI